MNKKSAGFILIILSILAAAASLAAYLINCRTDYFSSFGINRILLACILAGILVQLMALIAGRKGWKTWMDILPVASSTLFTAATVWFIGTRINEIAFIMTFQKNDNTLADMRSAVIGIAFCLAAAVICWIASFFDPA